MSSTIDGRIWRVASWLPMAHSMSGEHERALEKAGPFTKTKRYAFIDLLRGFALVMMIETHVVNAYYPVALRKGSVFFFWLTFLNGLVAPAFLFAAGFSIVLQSRTQWDQWLRFRLSFWKQMRRLGFVLLVAYYSHLQGFRLSRYLMNRDNAEMWAKTFQVDILQCVVVSLLVVHAIILLLRKRWLLPWGTSILAGVVALATPWIWSLDIHGKLPSSLALLLSPHKISLFPIFPWIFFVLAGSCACHFFLKRVEAHKEPSFARDITVWGSMMIVAGFLLRNIPFTLPGYVDFYTTSPLYLIIRIGCILLICSLLYGLEKKICWIPKTIQVAGQESLLVYGVHLWVIFSFLRGKRMAAIFGLEAGYMRCFLMSLLIALLMLSLAGLWHSLKKNYPTPAKFGQALTVLIMIVVFALN
jgi:uncharacterized membrane protein